MESDQTRQNKAEYISINGEVGKPEEDQLTNKNKIFLYSLVVLLEIIGITGVVLVCVWTDKYLDGFSWTDDKKIFNWHPVFMTIRLVFLYGNGAIVYRVLQRTEKLTVKFIHACINATSFVFAILGLFAVFSFHNMYDIPNVYSLHSWIGIITVVLYGCQLLLGFVGFLYPKFSDMNRRRYLRIHTYFGIVLFIFAAVCAISGITEKLLFSLKNYGTLPTPGVIANCFGISIMIFAMLVSYILMNPDWKR